MESSQKLFEYAAELGKEITLSLDRQHHLGVSEMYEKTCLQANPYCTSTLRSLLYPNVPQQTGAKAHVDKSFFSIHFGDEGGQLLALTDKFDSTGKVISPPQGQAVVFFGVKILWVTSGNKVPLWHKSTTVLGQNRLAFVYFAHVPLRGYLVASSIDAYKKFFSKYLPLIKKGLYSWKS